MAPWQSIEVGFLAGVHLIFASLGFVGAVFVLGVLMGFCWWATEKLKP